MDTLTQREYWDGVHAAEVPASEAPPATRGSRLKGLLKGALSPGLRARMRAYDDHLLWNIYARHRPHRGATLVEVGSAPGEHLIALRNAFDVVPYGIEYSAPGIAVNRRAFAAAGVDPGNVIESDFFAPRLLAAYRGFFDVVLSRGFIEHFADPRPVVDRHIDLLKDGGLLIVSIPNLRGLNRLLCALFHRDVLALHNLEIMALERFESLFDTARVERLHCGYFGTFSFGVFNTRAGSPLRHALSVCQKGQLLLNLAFHTLLGDRGLESRLLSPGLIFVGVKKHPLRRQA
jgi:SAM-dependent methyltransferase